MPDGEEPVAEPTLESLNADMRAQSSLLRELATAVAQLTARDRVVDGEGAHGSGSGQRFAGQPTGSGGAAERPDLLELAQSGRVGAKSVSAEDDYLAVPELLQRAESGYEAVRPVSRVPGLFPLSTDLTNEYLKQDDRRLPAQEEYLWMSCFGAHMAALFVALDELLPYVPATNQDFTPYLARARNHAEAIDKAFRFRLAFLRRLNEIKRVHGDQGVLDVLRAQHFQPASEHLGSAIFGDLMRDYERRVFEATVASSAKATATSRVAAAAAGRGRGRGRGGGRGRGREARLRAVQASSGKWGIEYNNVSHTAAKLGDDDGVPQALRPKLKPLITDCGMTPKKALNRFTSQELRDAGVPEGGRPELLKKVQRWKRALAVKGKGVRALSSFADLQEWVDSNLLPAPQNMDDDVEVDKLFVLRNGVQAEAEAVAFSTIELLRTVQYVQLSGLPLHFMTDGTHKRVSCWVHLHRKVDSPSFRIKEGGRPVPILRNRTANVGFLRSVVNVIHLCRTTEQAVAVSAVLMAELRRKGESRAAAWLEGQYLDDNLDWNISTGVGGVPASTNPQESWHKSMKAELDMGPRRRATDTLLETTFQEMCKLQGRQFREDNEPFNHGLTKEFSTLVHEAMDFATPARTGLTAYKWKNGDLYVNADPLVEDNVTDRRVTDYERSLCELYDRLKRPWRRRGGFEGI
eukprot:jgi/Tetstr1/456623/TSEL_043326.t1